MALAIVVRHVTTEPDDVGLIRRIATGDRAAFEQLYLRYHRRLARFLMRFTAHYDVAEEIINDTLYVVWSKAGNFRGGSQVSTWIFGIAYRRALKTFKKRADHRGAEEGEAQEMLPDASINHDSDRESTDWLARGLGQLPVEQRMVLEMAYFLGNSCEEIARVMNCPVNTIKTRMFHARNRLRQLLPRLAEPSVPHSRSVP